MKYQTCLIVKGKEGRISEIVRANSIEQAIERLISVKNIPHAEWGYAHPLNQNGPKADDYRSNIRSSITGVVTMSDKRPRKSLEKEPTIQKRLLFEAQ
jgi:hypothetical protein